MTKQSYWIYILACSNNTYYTGYTTDLLKRYRVHARGDKSCKYTRSFKPTGLMQSWQVQGSKSDALQIEAYIKQLSRPQKENLIQNPMLLQSYFPDKLIN